MSNPCDRVGEWHVQPVAWYLERYDSGSVAVKMRFRALEFLNEETSEWLPWTDYDVEIIGTFFIVKKNGTPNDTTIASLVKAINWSGDLAAFRSPATAFPKCHVTTKDGSYRNSKDELIHGGFIVDYLNPYSGRVKKVTKIDDADATALSNAVGPAIRAIASNVQRNAVAPAEAPAEAPKTQGPKEGEDIPF